MRFFRRIFIVPALITLILGIFTGVIALTLVSAGEIYDYQDTVDGVHLPPIDAIICLAGGRGRIAEAGDVWYRYYELSKASVRGVGPNPIIQKPPVLYISGMGHQSNWGVLARQVRRGVLEALHSEHVILEKESENTEENAQWMARYARDRGWERVLLITSRYHMRRARYIFEKVLSSEKKPPKLETLSVYQEPFEPGEWRGSFHGVRVTATEYMKWLYYRVFWR